MIGLFGGSYDPIHLGHLITASEVFEEFGLDKIIFIPNYISPHKTLYPPADISHRVKMIELSIKDDPRFQISKFECDQKRSVYTYETIDHFNKEYSGQKLFLILGSDSFNNLKKWKNYKKILSECDMIVVKRPGHDIEGTDLKNVYISSESYLINISSNSIRKKVKNKLNILYLVNPEVERYINQNNLYH